MGARPRLPGAGPVLFVVLNVAVLGGPDSRKFQVAKACGHQRQAETGVGADVVDLAGGGAGILRAGQLRDILGILLDVVLQAVAHDPEHDAAGEEAGRGDGIGPRLAAPGFGGVANVHRGQVGTIDRQLARVALHVLLLDPQRMLARLELFLARQHAGLHAVHEQLATLGRFAGLRMP